MMIQLFDVQGKKVCPHANCYLIPELKAVIEEYPKDYLTILAYVFFTTCPDGSNPYVNLDENTKEEVILADLKPEEGWMEDMKVVKAQEKCKKLYETATLRAFMGAKKALERIGNYLADEEITDGKDGNALTIDRYMSKLGEYTDTYSKLENKLIEEQAKVRGNLRLRYDQKPSYVNMKEDKESI